MAVPFNPGPSTSQFAVPQSPFGNLAQLGVLSVPVIPVSVAASTTVEQTFTVTGLQVADIVFMSKPSLQAGLSIGTARVSALNTLAVTFSNMSAAAIVPLAESYAMLVARPQPFIVGNLPVAMPLL